MRTPMRARIGAVMILTCWPMHGLSEPMADTAFVQEVHDAFPLPDPESNDVKAVACSPEGTIWAATANGVWSRSGNEWSPVQGEFSGTVFDVFVDPRGTVWAAAWDGLYERRDTAFARIQEVEGPISVIAESPEGILAAGPDAIWSNASGAWTRQTGHWPASIRGLAMDSQGELWIATRLGLYCKTERGDRYYHDPGEILTGALAGIALAADGGVWIGGLGGLEFFRGGESERRFTTADGLPTAEVQCLAFGPDGRLWVGTSLGVTRYNGTVWSLRHGRRWLLDDDVRDVAFGPDGTAWIATGAGVSAIRPQTMSLAEKANRMLEKCEDRHVRAPGLVEKCRLNVPGDLSSWEPMDDDNDGQYTAMHLAAESYRFATTRDAEAREKAKRAFHALEYLQTATGTEGFVARSVIPIAWNRMADANKEISKRDAAVGRVNDPRWKPVQQRWRPTADGKWLWKGDTSSDEITGHFYGYYIYYMLAADDAEKDRIRTLVRRIMDHIIDGGFNLNDIDGTHTRWGVWAPEKLNDDPNWRAERGINSQEILSFLKATYAITGDAKYEQHYRRLIEKHGYAENARRSKTYAPSERTHIDDELLALTYNVLLEQERDPELLAIYRESLDWWYKGLAQDESPFFNFLYGALGGENFGLDEGIAYLRDAPLDLIDWTVDNSKREDVRLVRAPEIEPLQTDRLMPPSERAVMRWDRNPWRAVGGDEGSNEQSPSAWLLPYWMGRYYGFIAAPES